MNIGSKQHPEPEPTRRSAPRLRVSRRIRTAAPRAVRRGARRRKAGRGQIPLILPGSGDHETKGSGALGARPRK